jgi:hypothetical protein
LKRNAILLPGLLHGQAGFWNTDDTNVWAIRGGVRPGAGGRHRGIRSLLGREDFKKPAVDVKGEPAAPIV